MLPLFQDFEQYDLEEANRLVEKWSPLVSGEKFTYGEKEYTYTEVAKDQIEQTDKYYVFALSTRKAYYADLRKVIFENRHLYAIYLASLNS